KPSKETHDLLVGLDVPQCQKGADSDDGIVGRGLLIGTFNPGAGAIDGKDAVVLPGDVKCIPNEYYDLKDVWHVETDDQQTCHRDQQRNREKGEPALPQILLVLFPEIESGRGSVMSKLEREYNAESNDGDAKIDTGDDRQCHYRRKNQKQNVERG